MAPGPWAASLENRPDAGCKAAGCGQGSHASVCGGRLQGSSSGRVSAGPELHLGRSATPAAPVTPGTQRPCQWQLCLGGCGVLAAGPSEPAPGEPPDTPTLGPARGWTPQGKVWGIVSEAVTEPREEAACWKGAGQDPGLATGAHGGPGTCRPE